MMRRATVCGVSAVCALLVCGTPSSSQAQETDAPLAPLNKALADQVPPDIRQKGLLTVVMSTSNPPAHVVDEKTKTMIGMDPDIGRALADELGLKEQVTGVEITQAIPGMQAGRYIVAIAMMSPTKERELVLDFFDYVASGVKLAVKTGNPHNIQMADMSVCGHSIAVNTGSAQDIRNVPLLSQKCVDAGRAPLTNARFPDFQTASLAVVSGRADAIMFDGPVIDYVARTTGQIEAVGQVDSKPLAIGVLKGSPMFPLLREAFIDLMQKGIYQKIMIKWGLGSNIVASPIINDPEG